MLALRGTDTCHQGQYLGTSGRTHRSCPLGALAAREKKSGQHRRGVSWRLWYTFPIERANAYARTALTESLPQEEPVVFLCQARDVRQKRPRYHLHPCLHRSVQTLQFSGCAICRHQEKKVRPLPKFGGHRKSTPRSDQCAHLSKSRASLAWITRDCRCWGNPCQRERTFNLSHA